ncbi:hypothetical protein I4U23_010494 [Adineta vaga]|nr:hypothetical protein I4U23_010494 [Adineta vaga]
MKRYVFFFSTGTVTGLFVSSVITRLKTKSSNDIEQHPYLNFIKYGLPSSQNLEFYQQYITSIDYVRRIPSWVGYSLSRDFLSSRSLLPTIKRAGSEFKSECQQAPQQFRATNEDYFDSGWSRGHMAPAGDHKFTDRQAIDETFILSANIVPQDLDNNANYWYRIEQFARQLADKFDFVHIITGPLFIPVEDKEKKDNNDLNIPCKQMTHAVIGPNEVHVPTHLFKCILVENKDQHEMAVGCFVVPNEPIDRNRPLTDFAVSIKDLEKRSGLKLFHQRINVEDVPFLCNETSCELTSSEAMPPETIEQVNYCSKVRRCITLEQLQQLWTEIENKQYKKLDNMLKSAYDKKLTELNQKTSASVKKIE